MLTWWYARILICLFLDPERLLLEQNNNWAALGLGFSFRIVPKQPAFVFLGFSSCCGWVLFLFFVKTMIQFSLCVGVLHLCVSFRKNLNEGGVCVVFFCYPHID